MTDGERCEALVFLFFVGVDVGLWSGVSFCGASPGSACRARRRGAGFHRFAGCSGRVRVTCDRGVVGALGEFALESGELPSLRPAWVCFREDEGPGRHGLFHVSRCRVCGGSKASKSRVGLFGARLDGKDVTGLERGTGSPQESRLQRPLRKSHGRKQHERRLPSHEKA